MLRSWPYLQRAARVALGRSSLPQMTFGRGIFLRGDKRRREQQVSRVGARQVRSIGEGSVRLESVAAHRCVRG